MILSMRNPLLTSYDMFMGTNITIPKGQVQALCGDWEDIEINPGTHGPFSQLTMPDGSLYKPSDAYSLFYNLKIPFRSYDYANMGLDDRAVMDLSLYVIHEGLTLNPFTGGAGYSMLFIAMMAMWTFGILGELRTLFNNLSLAVNFKSCNPDAAENFRIENDKYVMVNLPLRGRMVLWVNVFTRGLVTTCLFLTGCFLITYTTGKMDLILNALALLFVLELDDMVFYATTSTTDQELLEDIEPVAMTVSGSWHQIASSMATLLFPIGPILMSIAAAFFIRWWQLKIFHNYWRMTAAICLFAGPTPGGDGRFLSPVTGFCDSLLGAACAPEVIPKTTRDEHGLCVLTDQKIGHTGSLYLYQDDPRIFEGRYDKDGNKRSWVLWGKGMPELYQKKVWSVGPYQDIMRKNCLQMFQVSGFVEDRLVDDDVGETMNGAPYYCERETLWKALFGKFTEGKPAATEITMENMEMVADLFDPAVVAAIDACSKSTPVAKYHPDWPSNALLGQNSQVRQKLSHNHRLKKHQRRSDSHNHQQIDKEKKLASETDGARSQKKTIAGSGAILVDKASAGQESVKHTAVAASKRQQGSIVKKDQRREARKHKKLGPAGVLAIDRAESDNVEASIGGNSSADVTDVTAMSQMDIHVEV